MAPGRQYRASAHGWTFSSINLRATNNALPATPWSARAAQQVAHELYQRVWSQGEFWVLDLLLTDDHRQDSTAVLAGHSA